MGVVNTAAFVLLNGLVFGSLLALTAVGLSLIFGILGVPNFAQGEFAAASGFVVIFLLDAGVGIIPAILVALALVFVLGVVSERLVVSRLYGRENFLLLAFFATFGLTLISENALRLLFGGFEQIPAPEFGSFVVFGVEVSYLRIGAGLIALGMLGGLYLFTRYTYVGLAMRAVSDDRQGAEMLGIDYDRISMATFGIGALLTGVSGILYGMIFTIFPTLGVDLTAFAFTIVVVGGVGSFTGVILASLGIGIVDTLTATAIGSEFRFFSIFLVLFVVLTLKPGGLGGVVDVDH